ncbi:MAG: hypothetical protein RL301_577 [Actinomycetota bacterium]
MAPIAHTGLILVTGVDNPGIAKSLFEVLAPFSIEIIDIEQLVIRDRLILTVLIKSDPAHSKAIESDLDDFAQKNDVDVAADFSNFEHTRLQNNDLKKLVVLSESLKPDAFTKIVSAIDGNIVRITKLKSSPITVIQIAYTGTIEKLPIQTDADALALPEKFSDYSRKFVILDVDSTLIEQEAIELLAVHAGVGDKVKQITARAMNGELDFAQSLTERVSLLAGLPEDTIATVRGQITLSPGAKNLISNLIERGHGVGVVSGGFIEIIKPLIDNLQIKHYRANSLEIENGKLTGKIIGPIIDRAAKANALKDFAKIESIPLDATIAIGDGANDLEMIEIAGYGIAYRAKPKVQESADGVLNTKYLDSILYLI